MHTTHTPLTFADHTLHIVEFDPDTFQEHDLFWLPHHTQLQSCGRKRKAEHLAGRIAAVHALREYGIKTVPGIGGQRQPLWPQKLFGSISHSTSTALAVVSTHPVGLDIEAIFMPQTAVELAERLRQRIANASIAPVGQVTISIGIAHWIGTSKDIKTVFKRADENLYMAKADGRNCTRF